MITRERIRKLLSKPRTTKQLAQLVPDLQPSQIDTLLAMLTAEGEATYEDKPHPEYKGVKERWWRRAG